LRADQGGGKRRAAAKIFRGHSQRHFWEGRSYGNTRFFKDESAKFPGGRSDAGVQVKKPEDSKYPWDYYQILARIPGERAFGPPNPACPLVNG
jgi:hypothetical protein